MTASMKRIVRAAAVALGALFATLSWCASIAPGTDYPAHRHTGVEELHMLHGKLRVDDKTLYPGDYMRSEAGSVDHRVWSETGCTCVLLTSTRDVLR